MINALQHLGSRQSSTKLGSRKENAYAEDHKNIKHSDARNIHAPSSPKTLLPQEPEYKSNASAPSIVNNQKSSLPLLVPSSAGEDGRTGAWLAVIGHEGVDVNIRGNSTTSDFTEAKGFLKELESSQVKSIFVWNSKTRFIRHCPQSPDTTSIRRIAANTSTYRLQSYKHLYISTTSQLTWTTPRSSAHHNSPPGRSGDRACKGEPENGDDGPIYGSVSPRPRTGGASRPNESRRSSTGITMVQNPQAGDRLNHRSNNFIKNPK